MLDESSEKIGVVDVPREGPDWTEPRSPDVPAATYWPAIAALAVVTSLFGILTSWAISAVGLIIFVIAMNHWIGELNRGA
ncbi:MAG: hypothetical protein P8020_00605 [Acidobacteriota bacterium]